MIAKKENKKMSATQNFQENEITIMMKKYEQLKKENESLRAIIYENPSKALMVEEMLQQYTETIKNFALALHFATTYVEKITPFGIYIHFGAKLFYDSNKTLSENSRLEKIKEKVQPICIKEKETGFNLQKCFREAELLDTDENRNELIKLMTETFPKSKIFNFTSTISGKGNYYVLHTAVFFPYESIEHFIKIIEK